MKLRLISIIEKDYGRYAEDRRRKVNTVLASYVGDDGHEYRKRFSSYGEPIVPETGNHESLNAQREQFD